MATTWKQRTKDGEDVGEPMPVRDTNTLRLPPDMGVRDVDPPDEGSGLPPLTPGAVLAQGRQELGGQRANEILAQLPTLGFAVQNENWTLARETIDGGLTAGVMTADEHDALTGVLDDYGV